MSAQPVSDALVLFGITGDLAFKKLLPALGKLVASGLDAPIIGVARSAWNRERLLDHARASLEAAGEADAKVFARLAERLDYVQGDYADPATFDALCRMLGDARHPLFYLAIPPDAYESVAPEGS